MLRKKIRTEHCKNCNYDFRIDLPNMKYCPNCGQENHSPRRPFFHYLYELIEGIFHLDNKTWLTIKTLFVRPGQITKDFIEDKRSRYSPPVRMYIWCTAFFMFSFWLFTDKIVQYSEPASESSKSLSQRFDEMPDSSSTTVSIIANRFWPTLPSAPISSLRVLKNIPNNEIKNWLQEQKYPTDYFHIQLVKAFRVQINSSLSLSAFTKKLTAGNNILFVLLLPLNALLLFPLLYRKKLLYYDSMIFTLHVSTWIPLFQAIWFWVLGFMIGILNFPSSIFLSVPIINAVYFLLSIKKAFGYNWASAIVRWLPVFIIDTFYHWLLLLLNAAWFI
ncbi:MAG: DUF3667 domain-containing protein [Saprospiraceae bacterium]|nr:DUF3667 domain-containing protein [Saprospiraceae bacterium]